jgi:hypothetical protein
MDDDHGDGIDDADGDDNDHDDGGDFQTLRRKLFRGWFRPAVKQCDTTNDDGGRNDNATIKNEIHTNDTRWKGIEQRQRNRVEIVNDGTDI